MIQTAIDFDAATLRAERGIQESADHADAIEEGWCFQALAMLTAFAAEHAEPFLIEEVRQYAAAHNLPPPPSDKAWGRVARMALSRKRIEKAGYAKAASSNGSPKNLWRKVG